MKDKPTAGEMRARAKRRLSMDKANHLTTAAESDVLKIPATAGRSLSLATLCKHVVNVVSSGANEEVLDINAGRVVTFMKHVHACRDSSGRDHIRNSMGEEHSVSPITGGNNSVAVSVRVASPKNTPPLIGCANVTIEPRFKRNGLPLFLAVLRTKPTSPKLDLTWVGDKWKCLTASLARSFGSILSWGAWHIESCFASLYQNTIRS